MSSGSEFQHLLSRSLDAHIEAVKENSSHLEAMGENVSKQTFLMEKQLASTEAAAESAAKAAEAAAIAANAAIAAVQKSDLRIAAAEVALSEKIGSLLNNLKLQWATITLGILPITLYTIKHIWQNGV